jgi:tetratricopeptide (TPR) repeat protein
MKKFKTIGLITTLVMSSFFLHAQNRNELIAWEVQGDTLLNRGDFKGAAELFTKLISKTKFSTPEDFDLFYKRGVALMQMGNLDAALADANRYKKATGDDQGHVLKVYIYQEMDKLDEALSQIDSLQQKYPDNPDLAQWKIQTLMGAERHADAKAELQKVLAKNRDPKLLLSLGLTHYYLGELEEAFAVFDGLIKEDPTQPEPYLYVSSLCLEDGLYEMSLKYAERGLAQNSSEPNLMFYKGIALHELGKSEEGCRFMARAFNKGVDDAGDYLKEYCYGVE